jgi:hypothetical protein
LEFFLFIEGFPFFFSLRLGSFLGGLSMRFSFFLGSALFLTLSILPAQLGKFLPNPTFPGASHRLDVQGIVAKATGSTAFNAMLGIARDNSAHYWVTSRRNVSSATNPHMLWELWWDTGKKAWQVKGYAQPSGVSKSNWGIRDLAFDGKRFLYGGAENLATGNTVFAFDVIRKQWDPTKNWKVPVVTGLTTTRALAYDPNGDQGRGSLWTCNFSNTHVEFDRSGKALRIEKNMSPFTYGAAYDPIRKTIWWWGQGDQTVGKIFAIGAEMDAVTGKATGNRVVGDQKVADPKFPGGLAGGAEFYMNGGTPTLVLLTQATTDTVYEVYGRFSYGKASAGSLGMNGFPPLVGWTKTPNFGFQVTGAKGSVAILMLGFSKIALPLGGGFLPGSSLYIAPALVITAAPIVGTKANIPLPLPNVAALKGATTYWQSGEILAGPKMGFSQGGETVLY